MNYDRKIAVIVGVFYVLATAAGVACAFVLAPFSDGAAYLSGVAENELRMIIGIGLYMVMALACPAIAIAFYPVLKRRSETLAFAHTSARVVEGALFLITTATLLGLVALSKEFIAAGSPNGSSYTVIANTIHSIGNYIFLVGYGPAFLSSVFIMNYMLFKTRLVPRWLSVWGLASGVLATGYFVLMMFNVEASVLNASIGIQEIVLAGWLIFKGFNPEGLRKISTLKNIKEDPLAI